MHERADNKADVYSDMVNRQEATLCSILRGDLAWTAGTFTTSVSGSNEPPSYASFLMNSAIRLMRCEAPINTARCAPARWVALELPFTLLHDSVSLLTSKNGGMFFSPGLKKCRSTSVSHLLHPVYFGRRFYVESTPRHHHQPVHQRPLFMHSIKQRTALHIIHAYN